MLMYNSLEKAPQKLQSCVIAKMISLIFFCVQLKTKLFFLVLHQCYEGMGSRCNGQIMVVY